MTDNADGYIYRIKTTNRRMHPDSVVLLKGYMNTFIVYLIGKLILSYALTRQ